MLQIAVIGLGNWGPRLVRCLRYLSDCRLAVLCDIDPFRLQAVAADKGQIIRSTDWRVVVENPAVLAIAQYLQSGVLGVPLLYRSMRLNMYGERQDTDVLWDLAWHDLAIVDFLFPGKEWAPAVTQSGRYANRLDLHAAAGRLFRQFGSGSEGGGRGTEA